MASFTGCILIDSRTSGAWLPRQLAAVAGNGDDGQASFTIVVADDTGDSRLPDLVSRFGARLTICPAAPLGARLNAAILDCTGDVLLLPMARRVPSHDRLTRLAAGVANQTYDAAVLPMGRTSLIARLLSRLRRSTPKDALCVSRDWFERIGGFDPELENDAPTELIERLHACGARVETLEP